MSALDGKVGLVTGASSGIGAAIAREFGRQGASVVINYVGAREPAEAVAGQVGAQSLAIEADVSNAEAVSRMVQQAVEQFGKIDVLVNNAGATWGAPFEALPLEAWDKVVRTNVDGTFFVSRQVGLHMIERGQGGRIINIASVAGLRGSDPEVMPTLPYNTSKGAVVNFTRALAATLAQHNITVNCICPGFFPTKMTAATLGRMGERIIAATPLRRVGGDQDLKGIAVLLASDASAYITGQVIAVDGGFTAI